MQNAQINPRHPEVRARSASLEGRRPCILRGAANAAHLRMTGQHLPKEPI
jgi:hypothetical protein